MSRRKESVSAPSRFFLRGLFEEVFRENPAVMKDKVKCWGIAYCQNSDDRHSHCEKIRVFERTSKNYPVEIYSPRLAADL